MGRKEGVRTSASKLLKFTATTAGVGTRSAACAHLGYPVLCVGRELCRECWSCRSVLGDAGLRREEGVAEEAIEKCDCLGRVGGGKCVCVEGRRRGRGGSGCGVLF